MAVVLLVRMPRDSWRLERPKANHVGAPADLAMFEAEVEAMAREGSGGRSAYVTFITRESGAGSARPDTPSR